MGVAKIAWVFQYLSGVMPPTPSLFVCNNGWGGGSILIYSVLHEYSYPTRDHQKCWNQSVSIQNDYNWEGESLIGRSLRSN